MNMTGSRAEEARRKSQERIAADHHRAVQVQKEREKAQAAETAKMRRLRALRLAKEASDKEAADRAVAVKAHRVAKPHAA